MAGIGFNTLVNQGTLNRVATHVVVPGFPQLNTNAGYMSKSMAVVTFEEAFTQQPETATGVVNSPNPYVMATLVVNVLRSQLLSGAWVAQTQANSNLGTVIAYPDSSVFPPIALSNASITAIEPGAFDGSDPTVKVTIRGVFYVNANLWASLTGPGGVPGI